MTFNFVWNPLILSYLFVIIFTYDFAVVPFFSLPVLPHISLKFELSVFLSLALWIRELLTGLQELPPFSDMMTICHVMVPWNQGLLSRRQ